MLHQGGLNKEILSKDASPGRFEQGRLDVVVVNTNRQAISPGNYGLKSSPKSLN